MSRTRAIVYLVATALLFSLSGMFIKLLTWDAPAITGVRAGIAALVALVLVRSRPQWDGSRAQWGALAGWVITSFALVLAMKLGTAANAIALMFSAPIYAALLGHVFLGEKLRRHDVATLPVVVIGVGLVFMDRLQLTDVWGNVFGVLSGVGFALYAVCLRALPGDGAVHTTFFGNVVVALIGIPFGLGHLPTPRDGLVLLALGVLTLGVPSVLFALAIRKVTALESVLILALEPVFLPIWVLLTVGELPGPWAILGSALLIVAIVIRGIVAARVKEVVA